MELYSTWTVERKGSAWVGFVLQILFLSERYQMERKALSARLLIFAEDEKSGSWLACLFFFLYTPLAFYVMDVVLYSLRHGCALEQIYPLYLNIIFTLLYLHPIVLVSHYLFPLSLFIYTPPVVSGPFSFSI
jgi:hypothetical protein